MKLTKDDWILVGLTALMIILSVITRGRVIAIDLATLLICIIAISRITKSEEEKCQKKN